MATKKKTQQFENPLMYEPEPSAKVEENIQVVVMDIGNGRIKAMLMGLRDTAIVMDSAVAFQTSSEWDLENSSHSQASSLSTVLSKNTMRLGYRSRTDREKFYYCTVGDGAKFAGRVVSMTDEIKYSYDTYLGACINAVLMHFFPQGHDHVIISFAHPTKTRGKILDEIKDNCLIKRHVSIRPDGVKISHRVREVIYWPEPLGGMIYWTESKEYKFNAPGLESGSQILAIDFGGGITSFTRMSIESYSTRNETRYSFVPNYNPKMSPSINQGMKHIKYDFAQYLMQNAAFRGIKEIDDRMISTGLSTGFIKVRNEPVDVTREQKLASNGYLHEFEAMYKDRLEGGKIFAMQNLLGGGMVNFGETIKKLLDHPYVYYAGDLENASLWNLFGGDELTRQWFANERGLT